LHLIVLHTTTATTDAKQDTHLHQR